MDYCGIADHLVDAMEIFSSDLKPDDVMVNISSEAARLQMRHGRLVEFFKGLNTDRKKNRQEYVDKAVHYLEPTDIRDNVKELMTKFNRSLNIVLPDESALKYRDDFTLYNEIKLEASNTYVDKSLKISRDESKKLQQLINEHLRAKGITSLLDEPVSIIDVDKFQEEIDNTKNPKSRELKRTNRLKHRIKVKLDDNPDFYQPLADKLEELIKARREERISQLELFEGFDMIQQEMINKNNEAKALGFKSEREFAVYKTLETLIGGDAVGSAANLFTAIEDELSIAGWSNKNQVMKSMRVKIKGVLRGKIDVKELQKMTTSLLELIKRN